MVWWNPFSWFSLPVEPEPEPDVSNGVAFGLRYVHPPETKEPKVDTDTIADAIKEVIEEGIDEMTSEVKDKVQNELRTLAHQAATAAMEGDTDTLEVLAGQVLLVGEIARITGDTIAREKARKVIETAFATAMKIAVASL